MKVNNVDSFAKGCKYMVIRIVDGEAWFYDARNDGNKAIKQAVEVEGHVIPTELAE